MADENPNPNSPADNGPQEGDSLEGGENQAATPTTETTATDTTGSNAKPPKKRNGFFKRFSVYLLAFVFLLIIAVMIVVISALKSKAKPTNSIASQTLSQGSVNQLATSDVTVGDVKQTLNVQSNAVFAGQVLIRKDLEVAGKLKVGGDLSLTGITVSGSSVFDTVQANKNLNVAGDTALQGQLTVQKSLNVNGGGTFNGPVAAPQLTVNSLQLSGDLQLTHHIIAGGATPGRTPGNALGGGGSASVSGSDTAGSISINTGGSPAAGCMVTVTFTTKFTTTPHVVITPVEAAAASINYYVTRTTSSFSVCAANAPPAGQAFGFDYVVFD